MSNQPLRLVAGDPNPLAPADMLAAGIPAGTVATAERINEALDRLRSQDPDGRLPERIQAAVDRIATARAGRAATSPQCSDPRGPDGCPWEDHEHDPDRFRIVHGEWRRVAP